MNKKNAFTLIEILISILIVAVILVAGFSSYIKIGYGKISLMEKAGIEKNSFYFSERVFQLIKEGGSIDYEEYFNRKIIGLGIDNGHYKVKSGFGNYGQNGLVGKTNYGNKYYYCRSGNNISMKDNGCYDNPKINTAGINFLGMQQRYGQYSFQFIDYNSDANGDLGDQNNDGNIIGDDDDENLGLGPSVFDAGKNVHELYLLSGDKKTRTFLRWSKYRDNDAPNDIICNPSSTNKDDLLGCIGTIEYIKLTGLDWGLDHNLSVIDNDGTQFDGVIDTWIVDKQFTNGKTIIAGSENMDKYWTPLFPNSINVTDFNLFVYPNIDYNYAWKLSKQNANISPYIILNYKIKPSWQTRKKLKSEGKEISINTTINLTDIFSK